MKRYQKIIIGLAALSTMALGVGDETKKFEICKCGNFAEECSIPSFSLNVPSGMAGGAGGGYIGLSGITDKDDTDGGLSVGMGYGDSDKIGGTISLGIGSINPVDGGAFNRGSLNISAGHNFREQLIGVAVGMDNINIWHDNGGDHDTSPSMYLAVTKLLPNDTAPMVFTVGAGNNNFAKVNETGDKKDKIYPFVSGAIYIMPQVSLIADYSSDIVSAGVGLVPFPHFPLSVTAGVYDLTKEREEDKISFIGSVCVCFKL
ncbi:hypothetical protein [Fusobacterium sp. IOR10]|jgi:hypothetical protein|uniref:hypothetical protein n=1 Tax=Fusobacterium sp. IOR10 TaxID=2665157 RepID=UPI0013D86EF1|nr:hypothetical protein [Fusobacterium sp. IOR10]